MKLSLACNLKQVIYDNKMIVFDASTGQTHCLDESIQEIFNFSLNNELDKDSFVDSFLSYIHETENTVLKSYLQDMINQLIELELFTLTPCK